MKRILFNKHERHSTGVVHKQGVHKWRMFTATAFLKTNLSSIKILKSLNEVHSETLSVARLYCVGFYWRLVDNELEIVARKWWWPNRDIIHVFFWKFWGKLWYISLRIVDNGWDSNQAPPLCSVTAGPINQPPAAGWFHAQLISDHEHGGHTLLRNVGSYTEYTALFCRR